MLRVIAESGPYRNYSYLKVLVTSCGHLYLVGYRTPQEDMFKTLSHPCWTCRFECFTPERSRPLKLVWEA